jgi:hypothetical protein
MSSRLAGSVSSVLGWAVLGCAGLGCAAGTGPGGAVEAIGCAVGWGCPAGDLLAAGGALQLATTPNTLT